MIPIPLKVTLIIGILIYFILILVFLKRKALELKYTLLWMAAGALMLVLVIFPQVLVIIARMLGIVSIMNALFICSIGFLVMLTMALTSIVSKQMQKINILVQQHAILENEVKMLKERIEKNADDRERTKSFIDIDNV